MKSTITSAFLLLLLTGTQTIFAQNLVNRTKGNTKDHFVVADSAIVTPTTQPGTGVKPQYNLINGCKGNIKNNFTVADSAKVSPTKTPIKVVTKTKGNTKDH